MATEEEYREQRENTLTVLLSAVGVIGFIVFLVLISNGMLLFMLLGAFAILGLGALHYLLWGFDMSRGVAGEREKALEEEENRLP